MMLANLVNLIYFLSTNPSLSLKVDSPQFWWKKISYFYGKNKQKMENFKPENKPRPSMKNPLC